MAKKSYAYQRRVVEWWTSKEEAEIEEGDDQETSGKEKEPETQLRQRDKRYNKNYSGTVKDKERRAYNEEKSYEHEEDEDVPQPPPCRSLSLRILRYASFAAILVAWVWMTSFEAKIRAVMVALTFSFIEFHFRAITRKSAPELSSNRTGKSYRDSRKAIGQPVEGNKPADPLGLRAVLLRMQWRLSPAHILANGHTTWEQFWGNVLYGPIMNDFYRDCLFALVLPSFLGWHPMAQSVVRAVCYPINIWVAEVAMGYYLAWVWRRRAWYYRGRWALMHGNITLAYGPLWKLLGALYEVGFPLIYAPVPACIASLLVFQ